MGFTEYALLVAWAVIIALLWTCHALLNHIQRMREQLALLRRLYRG